MRRYRYLILFLAILALIPPVAYTLINVDVDSNNAVDVDKGGTNATTASAALTNLGAMPASFGSDAQYDIPMRGASAYERQATGAAFVAWLASPTLANLASWISDDGTGSIAALANAPNVSGGYMTLDGSKTPTNMTFDANGTGNTLKGYSYIIIPGQAWRNYGAGVTAPSTTATSELYMLPKFVNSTDEATNYVDYVISVPPDIDTSVALTATLAFRLGGADTGDHDYVLSMCNPAASAATACTPGNAINLTYTADASGADGDVEYTAETTLTDWAAALTAGRRLLIRLARDGDDGTNDASTVDSYPDVLTIKYGYTN